MPVTRTEQARIELSRAQCKTLAELFGSNISAMVAIEETNMPGTLAVQTNRGFTLINEDGTKFDLRRPKPVVKNTPRAGSAQRKPRTK
jgi:hypothetical protein